mmetsp:Transcript_11309/g.37204  ORF Transcript_11309/g.37204 Transcript_11309/m.37204 type:complete len:94 (+) Transcript_11309:31-312(+)
MSSLLVRLARAVCVLALLSLALFAGETGAQPAEPAKYSEEWCAKSDMHRKFCELEMGDSKEIRHVQNAKLSEEQRTFREYQKLTTGVDPEAEL